MKMKPTKKIAEGKWEDMNKPETSGTFEKIKYILGQLGTYKVNGKILGKKKEIANAEARIEAIINKESNKLIKQLDNLIKETNPEFPNNLKSSDFLSIVLTISATYDSIIDATKKEDLPIDVANGIINDLREYVKNILDVKLAAAYSTVDEDKKNTITKEELRRIDEAFGLLEDAESDVRNKLKADRAARSGEDDTKDFKSTKIDTLKSNKLPLTLLGVGSALGGFSWLVNTEWFKSLFDVITPGNWTDEIQTFTSQITDIKDGEGVYKLLGRVTGNPLDGNSKPSELIDALKQIGGGDADKGVDLLCQKGGVMMKPAEAAKGLHDFIDNPDQYKNLNDFFQGEASGTGKLTPTNTTLYGTISGRSLTSMLVKVIPKIFVKGAVKTGAGYAIAKGLGAILGPIGVGLLGAGALVKLMRAKGLKTSRAATLNALYQSIRNIPGGTVVEPEGSVDKAIKIEPSMVNPGPMDVNSPIELEVPPATGKSTEPSAKADTSDTKSDDTSKKDKEPTADNTEDDNDDLYNTLKKTFKFIVSNKGKVDVNPDKSDDTTSKSSEEKPKAKTVKRRTVVKSKSPEIKVGNVITISEPRNKRTRDIKIVKISKDGMITVEPVDGGTIKDPKISAERLKRLIDLGKKRGGLSEGKYITDNDVETYIEKNLSYNKLKAFEELIGKIEKLRNKIKNEPASKDKDFNRLLDKFKSNPIMATDFSKLFKVSSVSKKEMTSLKYLIEDIFKTLYSAQFNRVNIIDKMASAEGGRIGDLLETYYGADDPNKAFIKDAQSRERLKNNLIKFLQDAIRLFQHMYSRKKSNKNVK